MGVRPPSEGEDDEPDVVTFGIAALDGRLDDADLTFPATAREVEAALGDIQIPYNASGNSIQLSTALNRTSTREFETRQDLLNALHPVFEERRSAAPSGLLGQLKAMLPF